jgi:AcrR family transcriptional regulator
MRTLDPVKYAAREGNILDAARKLFSKKGYRETGMKEISALCGLTKASLYHYFDGKDSILLTLLHQRIKELNLGSTETWRASTLQGALETTAKEYFHITQEANAHELLSILVAEGSKRREVGQLIRKLSQQYQDDFVEGAVGHGLIRPEEEENLKTAMYSFFGALNHYALDKTFYGKPMVKLSQEKYGRYVAAMTAESWKKAAACVEEVVQTGRCVLGAEKGIA